MGNNTAAEQGHKGSSRHTTYISAKKEVESTFYENGNEVKKLCAQEA